VRGSGAAATVVAATAKVDLAAYLPRKPVQQFPRGGIIYSPEQPSQNLYLVTAGRVKVSRSLSRGVIVCSIVHPGGLFGESALIGAEERGESAAALDAMTLMSWTRGEVEQQVEMNPRLGLALSQYLAQQCLELNERMESLVVHKTPERVMLALAQFAHKAGVRTVDGTCVRVDSLTHQTLAEYVGTSREVVTFQLNRLRRLGLIDYSRKYIEISVDGVEDAIRRATAGELSASNGQMAAG
jgi:CRP/FNR family cyclic AMP-dependent transcriptional regulator